MSQHMPNLLFVLADQMRGFDMGCAGNPEVITPNLDRLAADGMRFDRAFANAPVCTPSRGTMLTGRFPLDHGAIVNDIPLWDVPTIADVLAGAGYRTGYIGKWHLDGVPRTRFTPPGPRRHGFQYWAAYNCSHDYFRPDKYYRDDPDPVLVEGYEPEVQTDLACSFIRENAAGPFALYLSWGPPHDPYAQVPPRYRKRYDAAGVTHRPNVDLTNRNPLADGLDPARTLADYYAAITALDDQLGRLLDVLRETGAERDTVVVFSSDHGDMLWSHGMLYKQQPWEESIRIPLLVRWPARIPAGTVCDRLVSTIDYVPTLLALLGVSHDLPVAGRDLSGLFHGQPAGAAPSVFLMDIKAVDQGERQGITEWRGVRTTRYTYAERLGRQPWLLHDNVNDPYQLTNLAGRADHLVVQRELADELGRWLVAAGDQFLPGAEHLARLGLGKAWEERVQYMRNPARARS